MALIAGSGGLIKVGVRVPDVEQVCRRAAATRVLKGTPPPYRPPTFPVRTTTSCRPR